ncbi:MAG: hypothetical protein ACJ8R9_14165 [Steroidobacteraceae bacterium]
MFNPPSGYAGALASVKPVVDVGGDGSGVQDGSATDALNTDSIPESLSITPFSEEWAYNERTHASDYLPGLSLEILNGGIKMPAGVP